MSAKIDHSLPGAALAERKPAAASTGFQQHIAAGTRHSAGGSHHTPSGEAHNPTHAPTHGPVKPDPESVESSPGHGTPPASQATPAHNHDTPGAVPGHNQPTGSEEPASVASHPHTPESVEPAETNPYTLNFGLTPDGLQLSGGGPVGPLVLNGDLELPFANSEPGPVVSPLPAETSPAPPSFVPGGVLPGSSAPLSEPISGASYGDYVPASLPNGEILLIPASMIDSSGLGEGSPTLSPGLQSPTNSWPTPTESAPYLTSSPEEDTGTDPASTSAPDAGSDTDSNPVDGKHSYEGISDTLAGEVQQAAGDLASNDHDAYLQLVKDLTDGDGNHAINDLATAGKKGDITHDEANSLASVTQEIANSKGGGRINGKTRDAFQEALGNPTDVISKGKTRGEMIGDKIGQELLGRVNAVASSGLSVAMK